jgi:ABC-type nitrate/sulfonate/bicarbonate transport system permease component
VLPAPSVILRELVDDARSGKLGMDVLYSLHRVLTLGIIGLGTDAAFQRLVRAVAWRYQP